MNVTLQFCFQIHWQWHGSREGRIHSDSENGIGLPERHILDNVKCFLFICVSKVLRVLKSWIEASLRLTKHCRNNFICNSIPVYTSLSAYEFAFNMPLQCLIRSIVDFLVFMPLAKFEILMSKQDYSNFKML